jgi:hypothetical protein
MAIGILNNDDALELFKKIQVNPLLVPVVEKKYGTV